MTVAVVLILGLVPTLLFVCLALRWPGIAMAGSLLMSVAGVAVSGMLGYGAPGSNFLLISLATAVAVYLFRGQSDADRWPQTMAKAFLIVFGLLLATWVWLVMGGVWALAGMLFTVVLVALTLSYLIMSRRAVTHYIISTLAACMRQNMPLMGSLAASIEGRTDKRARMLRRIRFMLSQGRPLSESIRRGYHACPGQVVATVEAAERIDQVPDALHRLETDILARSRERRRVKPCPLWYPVFVALTLGAMLSTWSIHYRPTFERMFSEMGDSLPVPTQRLIDSWCHLGGPVFSLLFWLAAIGVPVGIYTTFRPRRTNKFQILSWLGDGLKWRVPIGRWFERNRSMLQTVEVLRLSLNAGLTMDQAIAATIELDVNRCFRRRLRRWLARVREGVDVAGAARASGLGRSLAWAFDKTANPGNTPVALETLESLCRNDYSYRINLVRFVGWPTVVVALALVVGYVVYALFVPMVQMTRVVGATMVP